MQPLGLRARMPGAARADVRDLDERRVVWVEVNGDTHKGALSFEASSVIETAARTAVAECLPLVIVMASSGAEIRDGFAALHGWGLAARALTDCSGKVPTFIIVDGPAVSGPALLLGIVDHVVM
ncbi:MAG: carboxyl transferase domain-containing protein, partial [Actinomycetota bacterium]